MNFELGKYIPQLINELILNIRGKLQILEKKIQDFQN
jgi:hypothetical protein